MASKRITISVPAETAQRIRRAAKGTRSVSAWVTRAVTRSLEEEDLTRRFLELCDEVPVTPAEAKQAQASFERITRGAAAGRSKRRTTGGKRAA